jgi:hypothetical protein
MSSSQTSQATLNASIGTSVFVAPSVAAATVAMTHDGRTDAVTYVGADSNGDGIPDALEMATVAVDATHDGKADFLVTGIDANHDGIPDCLQRGQTVIKSRASGVVRSSSIGSSIGRRGTSTPPTEVLITQESQAMDNVFKFLGSIQEQNLSLLAKVTNLDNKVQTLLVEANGQPLLAREVLQAMGTVKSDLARINDQAGQRMKDSNDLQRVQSLLTERILEAQELTLRQVGDMMTSLRSDLNQDYGKQLSSVSQCCGQIMATVDARTSSVDEKVMLQVNARNEERLGAIVEAMSKLKIDLSSKHDKFHVSVRELLEDHKDGLLRIVDGQTSGLHIKLDGHERTYESIRGLVDGMPDHSSLSRRLDSLAKQMDSTAQHDAVMKGVDSLLADHIGDSHGKMMRAIDRLPIPTDEKVLLNAIENSLGSCLGETLEAIRKMRTQLADDQNKSLSLVRECIGTHSQDMQSKLDVHSKVSEKLGRQISGMPDHSTLLDKVDSLLASHIGDHGGKITAAINKLPLPVEEKVMLRAIEGSLQIALGEALTSIKQIKSDFTGEQDASNVKLLEAIQSSAVSIKEELVKEKVQMSVTLAGKTTKRLAESGEFSTPNRSERSSSSPRTIRYEADGKTVTSALSRDSGNTFRTNLRSSASARHWRPRDEE